MKYRKKPVVIEAITFDELVRHGIDSGGNIVRGMPWSFQYQGHPITHENDDCYLIPTLEGTMKIGRDDMPHAHAPRPCTRRFRPVQMSTG